MPKRSAAGAAPHTATRRRVPLESADGRALFRWSCLARGAYPALRLLTHTPNGGNRDGKAGAMLAAEGARPGFPDYTLPAARGGFPGLFLELKRAPAGDDRGGHGGVEPEQRAFLRALAAEGFACVSCRGFDAAREALVDYASAGVTDRDDAAGSAVARDRTVRLLAGLDGVTVWNADGSTSSRAGRVEGRADLTPPA